MYLSTLKTSLSLMSLGVALAATLNGVPVPAYAAGPQDASTLAELKTQLETGLPGANLRTGPGPAFEVVGTVDDVAAPLSTVFYGIGVELGSQDSVPFIDDVIEGGPADRAGVEPGDLIRAVDGQDVSGGLALREVISHIRGEKWVPVRLSLFRPSLNQTLELAIVREEINPYKTSWECAVEPIRGFGTLWNKYPEMHQLLGCPFTDARRDEHATAAAVQTFEGGWMLWLEADTVANVDPIYVFFADDGSYLRYGDHPLADAHLYAPTEAGFHKVGDRFSEVYWEGLDEQGRTRLGRATSEARDSAGAFQEFEAGRMFWAGEADTIYVIYGGDYDFDGDGQFTYRQGWLSYEDTYEAVEP